MVTPPVMFGPIRVDVSFAQAEASMMRMLRATRMRLAIDAARASPEVTRSTSSDRIAGGTVRSSRSAFTPNRSDPVHGFAQQRTTREDAGDVNRLAGAAVQE